MCKCGDVRMVEETDFLQTDVRMCEYADKGYADMEMI